MKVLRPLASQRNPLLQIFRPKVRLRIAPVEPLHLIRNSIPRRYPRRPRQTMREIELVLHRKRPLQVLRPVLVLSPGFRVHGVPNHMHMRVLFVPVHKTRPVVPWCHPPRELLPDLEQFLVRHPTRSRRARVEIKTGVVVFPPPLVIEFLPGHLPRRSNLIFLVQPEVVRPGHALLPVVFDLQAEILERPFRRGAA